MSPKKASESASQLLRFSDSFRSYFVSDDVIKFVSVDADLFHGVTVAHCHCVVF